MVAHFEHRTEVAEASSPAEKDAHYNVKSVRPVLTHFHFHFPSLEATFIAIIIHVHQARTRRHEEKGAPSVAA